ncbi:MAG: SpoIID/LytB domain-containing protein [bacterium]
MVDIQQTEVKTVGACVLLVGAQRRQVARLEAGDTISLRRAGGRIRWSAARRSGDATALFVQSVDPRHLLRWQDTPYRGEILVLPAASGLTIVNVVELETYLRGVVPWEIGHHGEAELAAVEAQAVAARTYTLARLAARIDLGFDLWADVQDQVYRGASGEDAICDAAIRRTTGLVMRFQGEEIEAFYCSTCGGKTSNVEEVWPRPARPYLRSHHDALGDGEPFCSESPRFAWEEEWSGDALERTLAETLPSYVEYMRAGGRATWAGRVFVPRVADADYRQPGRLHTLAVTERTHSGRVARLEVTTDAGVYHVRGDRMRWVLPPTSGFPAILWSALCQFEVTTTADGRPQKVLARGTGFGHGVGMCQHGALGMARRGYSSRQILEHYYPGSQIESLQANR